MSAISAAMPAARERVTSSAAPVATPLPAGPAVDLTAPEESAVTTWGRAIGTGVGAFVVGFGLVAAWGIVDRRRRPQPLGEAAPPAPLGLPLSPGTTAWIAPADETDAVLEALAAAFAPWGSTLLVPRPGSPLAASLAGRTGHVFRLPQERPTAAAVARATRDLGPRAALLVDGPDAVEAPLADEPRTAVLAELIATKPAWLHLVLREGDELPPGVTQTVRVARIDGALRPVPPAA
jgi:hypothetical protein